VKKDISELFNLADQALFSSLLKNSHHVLHRLLPTKPTQPYNLRPRRHSFSLTQKQSSYDDCNFITRMLFYDIYWLNYFLALPRISLFHCAACHTWLLNEYMYVIMMLPVDVELSVISNGQRTVRTPCPVCVREIIITETH